MDFQRKNFSLFRIGIWPAIAILSVSFTLTSILFNAFALQIDQFNAKIRVFLTHGETSLRATNSEGLPVSQNARIGEFVSPFYVVHYGLIYSKSCPQYGTSKAYHWREDETEAFWPNPPTEITRQRFQAAADWIVSNISAGPSGHAHLMYNFDWPYKGYPNGRLHAPWWSGLTDGHAITLLLRAQDCLPEQSATYREVADELYESVVTPVELGGSLLTFNGHPWIEEYVDPRAPTSEMSRVLNGMVYAFFGVKAYEATAKPEGTRYADALEDSIRSNILAFDLGYWSDYDAIGNAANIKYHGVNFSLLKALNLNDTEAVTKSWEIGYRFPIIFYSIYGPVGIAKIHFMLTYFLSIVFCFSVIRFTYNFTFVKRNMA